MVIQQLVDLRRYRGQDVAVVVALLAALFVFRAPDVYELKAEWRLHIPHINGTRHANILPLPIIVDLDNDGINELIVTTKDGKLKVMTFPSQDFGGESVLPHLHNKVEAKLEVDNDSPAPVALTTGCLQKTLSNEDCYQSIIVVTSDWCVHAYDHFLRLMWKTKVSSNTSKTLHFKEVASLVTSSDGLVIVGGRASDYKHDAQHPSHNHSVNAESDEPLDVLAKKPFTQTSINPRKDEADHFTTYALDGHDGHVVWSHKPGDFEANQTSREHVLSSYHFKLGLQTSQYHVGEEHWSKYHQSLLNVLPYRWHHPSDTALSTARLVKSSKRQQNDEQSWFGVSGARDKHIKHNALVIFKQHGIEVLKLDSGSPMFQYPVHKERITLGDVNNDDVIDQVTSHFEARDDLFANLPACIAEVSSKSRVLFTGSICQTLSIFGGIFDNSDDYLHGEESMAVPPVLVKSPPHRSGIFRHLMGHNLRGDRMEFDSVFVVSTGKVTSFGAHGELNWQVAVDGQWKNHQSISSNPNTENYLPSMQPVAMEINQEENALFVTSWQHITLVSLVDGTLLASHTLPCQPVSPVTQGDFTNDGLTDFVVHCSDSYLGFSLGRRAGYLWTIAWVVSGVLVVSIALALLRFFENEFF